MMLTLPPVSVDAALGSPLRIRSLNGTPVGRSVDSRSLTEPPPDPELPPDAVAPVAELEPPQAATAAPIAATARVPVPTFSNQAPRAWSARETSLMDLSSRE